MFKTLQQQWAKRKLRDPRWEVLFQANDEEWVSVDCETTSLNVAEAEILSIGAVKVEPGQYASHHELSAAAADAKHIAKKTPGRSLFVERRVPA